MWAIDNFYFRYTNLVDAPSNDPLALLTPTEEADEVELRRDHKLERYWWEAISRAMMNRDLTSFTLAGNIIQSAFGILMLLLFTLCAPGWHGCLMLHFSAAMQRNIKLLSEASNLAL